MACMNFRGSHIQYAASSLVSFAKAWPQSYFGSDRQGQGLSHQGRQRFVRRCGEGGLMRCERNDATVVSRPKLPLRKRSRICAVSTSRGFARDGIACFSDQRPLICSGICCSPSSPIEFRPGPLRRFRSRDHADVGSKDSKETGAAMSARLVSFDQKRRNNAGTVLVREWDRHRSA